MGIRTPYRAEERSFGGFSRNHMASSMSALQTHLATGQIHAFGSDPEIYSLAAGMEMAGFDISSSKSAEACPKTLDDPLTGVDVLEFYGRPGFANWDDQNGDDSSLRWGFQGHGAAAGHHGLSLTLNTACHSDRIQVGGGCGSAGPVREVWNSKYLGPARELLSEICSVGVGVGVPEMYGRPPDPHQQKNGGRNTDRVRREYINACGSSSRARPACPQLDFVALHKRKTKLLSMLDELEGRYRRYRDRMGAVASSFEAAAGGGAAAVYTAVASNVMSRHFRRLRDGIVDQIRDTRETEPQANRGETPRLRILDQTLRRRRAFRQMNTAEGGLVAWRPQRGLPDQSVTILRAWLFEHFLHPYPSDIDKHILARQSGLSRSQVSNWFINARVRLWKPMVEEMYLEETKARDGPDASNPTGTNEQEGRGTSSTPKEPLLPRSQLLPAANPDCLSSILGGADPEKTPSVEKVKPHSRLGGVCGVESPPFEAVEMDFIDYSYGHRTMGGGVSLTLGLQQPPPGGGGDGGGRFEFPAAQGSLLYSSRGGRPVPYSILEGGGEVPYPGVVGAQLLHQFDPCDDLGNYQADIGSAGDPTGRRYLPVGSPNKN